MSLTNPTIHVPDTRVSIPSWVRHHLTWMLVALAVVATAALLTVTLVDSASDSDPAPTMFDADRGSTSAIDHRTAAGAGAATLADPVDVARQPASAATGSLRHESISANDHRLATQGD